MIHNPPHPGEMLRKYIDEVGKPIGEIAKGLGISRKNLSLILNEQAGISAEMAVKLSVAFGTSVEFWLNFQKNYELWQARQRVDTSTIEHFLETG